MSTERITVKDVRRAVERLAPLLKSAGLVPQDAKVQYEEGSPINGRAHRLFYSPAGEYGLHNIPGVHDYLGWSASEAEAKVNAIVEVLRELKYREGQA